MAAGKIQFTTHDETYDKFDYKFAISADGSVGTQGRFGGLEWLTKYPPPGSPPNFNGALWDNAPSGALGGMGIVQLMAPAGDDSADGDVGGGTNEVTYTTRTLAGQTVSGTGTVLDDNIEVLDQTTGQPLKGYEKVRYLAWRGFTNSAGLWVDDYGQPTYNNLSTVANYPPWPTVEASDPTRGMDAEGDIRPAPILLPSPFGDKSRVRTGWIDVGLGSVRLDTQTWGFNGPRRIDEVPSENLLKGPRYMFAGTNRDANGNWVGYVDYDQNAVGGIDLKFPVIFSNQQISGIAPNATFQGASAYEVTLAQAVLGQIADRYSQYQAELVDSGRVVGSYRIMSHTSRRLWLSPDQGSLPSKLSGLRLNIVERFFDVRTQGAAGLGPTYRDPQTNRQVPIANVRFGFAFHKDPSQALSSGIDPLRFPNQVGTFLYDEGLDLSDPAVQERIRQGIFRLPSGILPKVPPGGHGGPVILGEGAGFVKWDLLFNLRFSETQPGNSAPSGTLALSPSSPRPEVHFVVVPYRY